MWVQFIIEGKRSFNTSAFANIIMTELGDVVIKPRIANSTIKFYTRFVDDTLLLIKPDNVKEVHNSLNKFDKNLHFTVDIFQNKAPHFLDLELSPDRISIFRKDTNTGLYVNFTSCPLDLPYIVD